MRNSLAALVLVLVAACGSGEPAQQAAPQAPESQEPAPKKTASFPFNENIGWLHGPCLAISSELAIGAPVTLVITAEPQRVHEARILSKTDSSKDCPALREGRAEMNATPGTNFYALEGGDVGRSDMGFGIVTAPVTAAIVNGQAQLDLDQDGKSEVFSSCASSEGIQFAVWSEKPYQGEAKWSAYNYVDYELTPNCP